jgi:hypothetical protein
MILRPRSRAHRFLVWLLAAFLVLAAIPDAVALGKADKDTDTNQLEVEASKDWVFCVTAFDVSALSATQRLVGELSARRLARDLESVGLRRRLPEEASAYADFADNEARAAAGKELAEKRAARAELLYSGHPGWKYRKELAKADAAVDAAEEKLLKAEKARSLVKIDATVKLSEKNAKGVLPPEPKAAGLGIFCADNKLDALLMGSVEPYYGRMRLKTRLYSRYLRTIIEEDEIVFSSEDREVALEELSQRLSAFVGGVPPAALAVTTEPAEADIVVDGKLIGHGSVGPMEKRPAPTRIEVTSPGYEGAEVTVDLESGELSKVSIDLNPLAMDELAVETIEPKRKAGASETASADKPAEPAVQPADPAEPAAGTPVEPAGTAELNDVAVRLGALHVGVAPMVLTLPALKMAYIEVETKTGLGASSVVSQGGTLVLQLKPLPGKDAKPVENARHRFYGAFGRFSIALPIAFFMSGMAQVYENAATWSGDADKEASGERVSLWAHVAVAVAASFFAESAVRCAIYLHEANARATPLAKSGRLDDKQHRNKGR